MYCSSSFIVFIPGFNYFEEYEYNEYEDSEEMSV